MITPCPACGVEMPQAQLNSHLATCKAALARLPATSRRSGPSAGRPASGRAKGRSEATDLSAVALQPTGSDGRVPCTICGRKFSPDRIAKHQFICSGLKHGPPAKTQAHSSEVALSNGRRSASPPLPGCRSCAGTSTLRRPGAAASGNGSSQGVRRQAPAAAPRPKASNWRAQSEGLRAALQAARGQRVSSGSGDYIVERAGGGGGCGDLRTANGELLCTHCGRTFAPKAWERHEPQCKFIVNKPRPPPRSPPAGRAAAATFRGAEVSRHAARPGARAAAATVRGSARGPASRPASHGACACGMSGGGGGGISASNFTSADNPLGVMCSYHHGSQPGR